MLVDAGLLSRALAIPLDRAQVWAGPLSAPMESAAITTAPRVAMFLAQVAHESQGLTRLAEDLNYSVSRLMQVWPKRFTDAYTASRYAWNPAALAEYVYGGRLGNTRPGDAWDYRGSGLIQLTGRANFAEASAALGIDLVAHPDRLREDRDVAALVACWYWASRGCNELADDLPGDDQQRDYAEITRRINGGLHGHDDRVRRWEAAADEIRRAERALATEFARLRNAEALLGQRTD